MEKFGCRCSGGKPVRYVWAGQPVSRSLGESWQHALAVWFALKAANQEFAWGRLGTKWFDKYRLRTEAFIEAKLDSVVRGGVVPGNEVCSLVRAYDGISMFELRFYRDMRLLRGAVSEQIRHYVYEPLPMPAQVVGLHMHIKDVRGDDAVIRARQNAEIDVAMRVCERYIKCAEVR